MKRKELLFLLFVCSIALNGQKTIPLKDILRFGGIPIAEPILCDTVNVKGEKYESKNLLKTYLTEPTDFQVIHSDTDCIFRTSKPLSGSEITLWRFYLTPENFLPVTIEIKSPNAFEVYVDGEKNTEKKSVDKKWEKAGTETVSLKADPRNYVLEIKMLAHTTDSCETMLKVTAKTEKRDSTAVFGLSSSNRRQYWTSDFLMGKKIQSVSISPNGQFVLMNYGFVYKDGSTGNCCELTDLRTGKLLWREDPNTRQLAWMPQSNALYFRAKGFNGRELRQLDPLTQKETVLVKNLPEGSFSWSPKQNFLIFSNPESIPAEKGDLHRFINPEDRKNEYRSRSALFLYDLKTGLNRRLTFGREDVVLHDISWDEKQLLFGTNRSFLPEAPFSDESLFLLNLENKKVDTLCYHDKYIAGALFSPDGKRLLIQGGPNAFGGIGLNTDSGQLANNYDGQLFIMDLKTRKVEAITKNFDPSVQYAGWSPFDGKIVISAEDRDYIRIFIYDPDNKTFQQLPLTPDVINGFDRALEAPYAVYFGSTVSNTGKAYLMDLKTRKEKLLADPGKERLANVASGEVEDWNFTAPDGKTIYGRCYLPPHFEATRKYPVLVYYYGGTAPTNRAFEGNYPLHLYAAMGYVVYTLNPSGATGFGQPFSAHHVNAWGDYAADEIILGTKLFCRTHPFADSTRMGCLGASYGGFLTMYLQTKTDMFKAAVSHAGISSIASYWGVGAWGYTYSAAASAGSYPWNNPSLYWDHSPLYHADRIKTPLLLLHGSVDSNVPIGESIQMFTALKLMGKDVEFIRIEGEEHSVRNFSRKMEWQRTILAFFAKYLKADERWWVEMYKPTALEY